MKRIRQAKYDIFPLDRLLPIATVYHIFTHEYEREVDKSKFFRDRKYQRLREGYWAMFVAVFLMKRGGIDYFIVFPEKADNDVDILSVKNSDLPKPELYKLVCDVKEYTHYSESFTNFTEKSLASRIQTSEYQLIVGTYQTIEGRELELLAQLSKPSSTVFIVSCPPENQDFNLGIVTAFQGEDMYLQEEIDLIKDIPNIGEFPIVYEDVLIDKLV